ncbi:VanZ family protein, partial [Escherichia coli]
MKQSVFLEPAFNVLLLIPFGIYLRYYFRLSFMKTMIASFCLSLFFELTQLSGLYFIYPRPYRLFDVNDL